MKQNSTNPYKYGDDMKKFVDKKDKMKPKELDTSKVIRESAERTNKQFSNVFKWLGSSNKPKELDNAGFLNKDQVTVINCVTCGSKTSSVREIKWRDGDTLDTRDIKVIDTTLCFNCSTKK